MAAEATIHGKLVDIVGADAAEEGSVVIALCGYGSQVPRATDTALIAHPTSLPIDADTTGAFSTEVWGNDWIDPPGTYYTVTVRDGNGDTIQTNAYVFLGAEDYDLGTTEPFNPTLPLPPLPALVVNQLLNVAYSATPNFAGDRYTAWQITLTGDVTASTITGTLPGNLYTFIIRQDSVGGHDFTWPTNVVNPTLVDEDPSSITIQTFVADDDGNLYAIGAGTYYP